MDARDTLPPKKTVLKSLLQEGTVYLHVDPRVPGVLVPDHLMDQLSVVLQIGREMAVPIPDLDLTEQGVTATLSFSRKPFSCRLPWESVFAMVAENGNVMLWPSDIPDDLLDNDSGDGPFVQRDPPVEHGEPTAALTGRRSEQTAPRFPMTVIDGGRAGEALSPVRNPEHDGTPSKGPVLKLVN